NVTPTPTVLQLTGYLAYLAVVLALFLRPVQAPKSKTPTPPNQSPERSTT
ncbi:MAG: iron transporter, partial [Mycolicibacterium sp.]